MNALLTTDTTQTTAPLAPWRVAEAFMHILHALFGDPSQVAFKHALRLETHRQISSWLRCGEAMMRRLLLIEATAYAKPAPSRRARTLRKHVRKPPLACTPESPETWRVSFRCFAKRRIPFSKLLSADTPQLSDGCARGVRRAPLRFRSSQALAKRYEALRRVLGDPLTYARRLARQLRAKPHRAYRVLIAPPEARRRIDCYAELSAAAETSAALFNTS
ncbi:MAG: hypothetical protein ABL871_08420 [Terricaulis sp.]